MIPPSKPHKHWSFWGLRVFPEPMILNSPGTFAEVHGKAMYNMKKKRLLSGKFILLLYW
jgi:hypothetical protein